MKDISLFAVYDGHGGHEVAEWTGENLPKTIAEKFQDINTDDVEQVKETLSSIFHSHGEFSAASVGKNKDLRPLVAVISDSWPVSTIFRPWSNLEL